ncbi:MAG: lipopolysaccharide biosynthesis protein [Desulfobacula sp.]|nr:lipopolysaccharide biosynthesis protein [Desulfobacula sp.]
MDNIKSIAVKSIFWMASIRYISQLISWSVTILLIRILSPHDYGLMGMALAYMGLINIFFDLSIGEAILQKKDISEVDINTAFWICISFATLLYAATWPLASIWASFFSAPDLVTIVRVIGINLFFSSAREIPNRLLARDFEFKKRSFFELISAISALITSLSLALYGMGVWSLVIGEMVRNGVLTICILLYMKWIPKFLFSIKAAKRLLKFGIPITGHYLLGYVSSRSDSIIIGRVLGQDILGYYTVALSLSRIPITKGILIIQNVMFPLFSTLQNNVEECRKYFYRVVYIIAVFFIPMMFGMFAVSEEIVILILSPKWMPSLLPFRVFCIVGIMLSFTGVFMVILKSRGNTSAVFKYSLYSAILLPIGYSLATPFGLMGVALSWLFVFPLLFGYLFYSIKIDIGIDIMETFKRVKHAIIGSLLMVAGLTLLKNYILQNQVSFVTFAINIAIGIFIYISYFLIFSRQTFKDIQTIWKTLKS